MRPPGAGTPVPRQGRKSCRVFFGNTPGRRGQSAPTVPRKPGAPVKAPPETQLQKSSP